ncbi:MAG TPA: hypothetical protein DCX32_01115 [Candidatus Moranbacteria bacterium]|nr:MAG: hypothetical protein UW87_C0002G0053 [Candidatus Moranbacteria bacterium GW2011_GWC2_45_10]KKT95222.1 MAG: hypothetical protein UW95_C0003G0064 [Parcubacteria group bacterium GW2011_GWC1_45_14]HAV11131.1 hypothetical protein [Candidatus Moranbacteria bacterium]
MIRNFQIKSWVAITIILLDSVGIGYFLVKENRDFEVPVVEIVEIERPDSIVTSIPAAPIKLPPPPPPDMERMKRQGCVADGLLSGFGGDEKEMIRVAQRSNCYYFHRALESWADNPDFEDAAKVIAKVGKKEAVWGMFIAEAINTKTVYKYQDGDRKFDFERMCKQGKEDFWKKNICIPSFESPEYRRYLRQITQKAMDIGIQSFLFGQIFYQDKSNLSDPVIPEIIKEMREYAASLGMEIVIGAQTNDITDEEYLRNFDFIDGGVGLKSDGSIQQGACSSRWWKKPGDWCWALLWHKTFASKANNVFLHLDWTPKVGDDMSTFARMDKDMREETLEDLHKYFVSRGNGFMLPILAVLAEDNGGCYGDKREFYSPSNKYSCQDEDVINKILKNAWKK